MCENSKKEVLGWVGWWELSKRVIFIWLFCQQESNSKLPSPKDVCSPSSPTKAPTPTTPAQASHGMSSSELGRVIRAGTVIFTLLEFYYFKLLFVVKNLLMIWLRAANMFVCHHHQLLLPQLQLPSGWVHPNLDGSYGQAGTVIFTLLEFKAL